MLRFRPRISVYQLQAFSSDEIAGDTHVERGQGRSTTYGTKTKKLSAVCTTLFLRQVELDEWD